MDEINKIKSVFPYGINLQNVCDAVRAMLRNVFTRSLSLVMTTGFNVWFYFCLWLMWKHFAARNITFWTIGNEEREIWECPKTTAKKNLYMLFFCSFSYFNNFWLKLCLLMYSIQSKFGRACNMAFIVSFCFFFSSVCRFKIFCYCKRGGKEKRRNQSRWMRPEKEEEERKREKTGTLIAMFVCKCLHSTMICLYMGVPVLYRLFFIFLSFAAIEWYIFLLIRLPQFAVNRSKTKRWNKTPKVDCSVW